MRTKGEEKEMTKSPDSLIAEAYERHCEENHQADYEVCPDIACSCAYALERLYWPLYQLVVAGLEMSGVAAQIEEQKE